MVSIELTIYLLSPYWVLLVIGNKGTRMWGVDRPCIPERCAPTEYVFRSCRIREEIRAARCAVRAAADKLAVGRWHGGEFLWGDVVFVWVWWGGGACRYKDMRVMIRAVPRAPCCARGYCHGVFPFISSFGGKSNSETLVIAFQFCGTAPTQRLIGRVPTPDPSGIPFDATTGGPGGAPHKKGPDATQALPRYATIVSEVRYHSQCKCHCVCDANSRPLLLIPFSSIRFGVWNMIHVQWA